MVAISKPKLLAIIIILLSVTVGWESFVLASPSPTTNLTVTPGNIGPCTYFISKDGTTPVAKAMVTIGGLNPGDNVVGTAGEDFGAFAQPLINNVQGLNGGNICLNNAEYDVTGSQTCNMTAPGQSCGLIIRGAAIFWFCPGSASEAFGSPFAASTNPCLVKYTGTTTLTCLICYGQYQGSTNWNGGGMYWVGVDGNGVGSAVVNDCIDAFNVPNFQFYYGSAVNCNVNDIRLADAAPGGGSDSHIVDSLIGTQAIALSTGIGVNLDFGTGQTWVAGNFFAAQTYGYAIVANGAGNGFGNKIYGNQIEACAQGTSGAVKAGTCIYDLDAFDTIQLNTIFNGVDYDCVYGSSSGQFITTNICQGPINQQNHADGACYATDNAVAVNSFTAIAENQCAASGGHMNYCVYLNGNAVANSHNITIQNNRCSGWQSGGKAIGLTGTFDGGTMLVSANPGNWQPPLPITAGTSVWTYTDVDGYYEAMYLKTIGGISAWTCYGVTSWTITAGSTCNLVPGATMVVTWTTTAPVFQKEFTNP